MWKVIRTSDADDARIEYINERLGNKIIRMRLLAMARSDKRYKNDEIEANAKSVDIRERWGKEKRGKRKKMESRQKRGGSYSALNRSPPPPPRMIAFMNAKNRSAYSTGGTGLILCRSAFNPFQKCSSLFTTEYGVSISMTPK